MLSESVLLTESDLRQFDPRTIAPSKRSNPTLPRSGPQQPQPRLTFGSGADTAPQPKQETFGSRLHHRQKKENSIRPEQSDGVLAMRRSMDGGMEMSFIPQSSQTREDRDDRDEYSGGTKKKDRKIERFGAGLERGLEEETVEGEGRGGRSRRRQVGRSASKNTFRRK